MPVNRDNYGGDYIHYGIREHGMAAVMNGISLHGGFVPYGGTFLVFADYCRPAIRLSALMEQPVTYVMTHDSIGLGEDGPTHQPVETLAGLRSMPNLKRHPSGRCHGDGGSLGKSPSPPRRRQPCSACRGRVCRWCARNGPSENLTARGAYLLRDPGPRDVTLIATGSEVSLALEAADRLAEDGIQAAVVSAPCFELFAKQPAAYREKVLGAAPRVGVEAAVADGWQPLARQLERLRRHGRLRRIRSGGGPL